jgi:type IV pilus assembly protein PilB
MRYRIDGVLYEMVPPPKQLRPRPSSAASRSWRNLDIAERRLPQDGRIELKLGRQSGRPARRDPADDLRRVVS